MKLDVQKPHSVEILRGAFVLALLWVPIAIAGKIFGLITLSGWWFALMAGLPLAIMIVIILTLPVIAMILLMVAIVADIWTEAK